MGSAAMRSFAGCCLGLGLSIGCGRDAAHGAGGTAGEGDAASGSTGNGTGADASDSASTMPPLGRLRVIYKDSNGPARFMWLRYEDGAIEGPHALTGSMAGYIAEGAPDARSVLINWGLTNLAVLSTNPQSTRGAISVNMDPSVPQPAGARAEAARFTSDGSVLVFESWGADWVALYYVPITDDGVGDVKPLVAPHPSELGLEFVLAGASNRVAVRSDLDGDGSPETYATSVPLQSDAAPVPLVSSAAALGQLSRDGEVYVFRDGREGSESLFVVRIVGDTAGAPLAIGGASPVSPVDDFALAPDGSGVAFYATLDTARRAYYAPLTGDELPTPVPLDPPLDPGIPFAGLVWSPSATWLGYVAGEAVPVPRWHLARISNGVAGTGTAIAVGDPFEFAPDEAAAWQNKYDVPTDSFDVENRRLLYVDLSGPTPAAPEAVTTDAGDAIEAGGSGPSPSGRYRLVGEVCGQCRIYMIDQAESPTRADLFLEPTEHFSRVGADIVPGDSIAAVVRWDAENCGTETCVGRQALNVVSLMEPHDEVTVIDGAWTTMIVLPDP